MKKHVALSAAKLKLVAAASEKLFVLIATRREALEQDNLASQKLDLGRTSDGSEASMAMFSDTSREDIFQCLCRKHAEKLDLSFVPIRFRLFRYERACQNGSDKIRRSDYLQQAILKHYDLRSINFEEDH